MSVNVQISPNVQHYGWKQCSAHHLKIQRCVEAARFRPKHNISTERQPLLIKMHAYEVRALPRKRKEIEEDDQQPLFLRKVFSMISTCPPEIGGWVEHGETFVIKDSDKFSAQIIPTAFKHSKFASFVRQLNFCKLFCCVISVQSHLFSVSFSKPTDGFRKIRPDGAQKSHWWEFRHPFFKRDEPQLISKIKKSMHFDSNGEPVFSDQASAVKEMVELKNRVAAMENTISDLTGLVRTLIGNRGVFSSVVTDDSSTESFKRRRMSVGEESDCSLPSTASNTASIVPDNSPQTPADMWENMDGLFSEFPFDEDDLIAQAATSSVQPSNFLDVAVPMVPVSSPPLPNNEQMQGMVQMLAQAIGNAATVCPRTQQVVGNSSAGSGSACPCPGCQLVSAGTVGSSEIPAVAYTLAMATVSALHMKYGDVMNSLLHRDQAVDQSRQWLAADAQGMHALSQQMVVSNF